MQMARQSAALLCMLYHAAPALAFVAPGALAPGRPALQVPQRPGEGQVLYHSAACELFAGAQTPPAQGAALQCCDWKPS